MNWHSLHDFLHMGGYGLYVWGSFAATAAAIAAELLALGARERALQARLRRAARKARA